MFKKEIVDEIVNGTFLFEGLSKELRGDKEIAMEDIKVSGLLLIMD